MPILEQPQPGDVIRADFMRSLVATINALEQRVGALESTGATTGQLVITGRIPPTGPYRVGNTLTLTGRNFQFSQGRTRVFLNAAPVLNLVTGPGGSSDTQLVFIIPPVPGVAETGTEVTLRVLNQTEEVTAPLVLRPALPQLFGEVDVTWEGGVTPTTFNPGDEVSFAFSITSRAWPAADFVINPVIRVATGQSTWQSRLEVRDASQVLIPNRQIRLEPLEQRMFTVRITEVPAGTARTPFTLTVNASSGTVSGTSGALAFEVGTAVELPDTTIHLKPTQTTPPGALVGDTVTARVGEPAVRVKFDAGFERFGRYPLTLVLSEATSGWTVNRFSLNTPATYDIPQTSIPPGGQAVQPLEITIQPGSGASATGRVEVRLQQQGATKYQSFPLNLRLGT